MDKDMNLKLSRFNCSTGLMIVLALLLALVHFVLAAVLGFYGHVIDPTLIHKTMSLISMIMMLPFSLVYFLRPTEVNVYVGIAFSLLVICTWTYIYFRLLQTNIARSQQGLRQ